jgi:wyosine [tRNA(Phe)-imidazoG37] synthetase (radical SAM superfamily)
MKLLLANAHGDIFEHPELNGAVWDGHSWREPYPEELTLLPEGSRLFTLPNRLPIGLTKGARNFQPVTIFSNGEKEFRPWAVSAFLPPAYLRLLLPAYARISDAPYLTQWAYTAIVGGTDGIYAGAMRVDPSERWEPHQFDDRKLKSRIDSIKKELAGNPLVEHISHCATNYHCFAAKNFFLGRWEAGLPISRKCNANCLGCLSLQTGETPSSHQRISFTPSAEEIAQVAVRHLENAEDPLVSFGQGCEGEPLSEWEIIAEAIKLIRQRTSKGTIHLNTNGSVPSAVPSLAQAGLNSVRISLNSAREENYRRYFRPLDYSLEEVKAFIKTAKNHGLFIYINLLVMPGLNDMEPEISAFTTLASKGEVDLVQLKNLNIDPEFYLNAMLLDAPPLGMRRMVEILHEKVPHLRLGYFNLQKERF